MQEIKFIRGQGGVPKFLAGEDHISGFLMYVNGENLPSGGKDGKPSTIVKIQTISSIEKAEELGISAFSTVWEVKALHYHLSEIFRVNPAIILYVGIFEKPETMQDFREVKEMQNYAAGRLRQIAVYNPSEETSEAILTSLQGVANTLENEDAPLSILYAGKITNLSNLPTMAGGNKKNISVVISQDGVGIAADLFNLSQNEDKMAVSTVGNLLGLVSLAKVNESISWVKKFPAGVSVAAFCDGTLLRDLDKGVINKLDTSRFLFLTTYSGIAGTFYNDSHTMDSAQSDYCNIELERTMDKAVRGVRTYILPELGRPLFVDPESGKLSPSTTAFLELTANRALEQMERDGELSGYKVSIDPEQNVLASSKVEIVIKQVAVGVMRKISIQIGFTNKI